MKFPLRPFVATLLALELATTGLGAETQGKGPAGRTNALDWWSLKAIVQPAVPSGARPNGNAAPTAWRDANPIDAFIGAKLAEHGLTPSPPADPRTLCRRLYFDLLGLPPSPGEIDAFAAASAREPESACRALVDRLLASPGYGERWARHWLDVVHYGETHGYDKDQPRLNAWPYRDYVIRAFNSDKPYGRFVEEQIAGDALWPDTEDGITALGFIAAGPWDLIGHAEVPETKTDGQIARMLDRDDMVANVMNTFCSTTVQCARCHNHKFDPITQEEYYRLTAVFAALDRADKRFDIDPVTAARRAELEAQLRDLESKKVGLDKKVTDSGGRELDLVTRLAKDVKAGAAHSERPEFGWHSQIESRQGTPKWVQVDLGSSAKIQRVVLAGCHDDFNNIGAGFGFPVRFKIEASDHAAFSTGVWTIADQTAGDFTNPGVMPVEFKTLGKSMRFIRVTATKLAPRQNDFIFALAELMAFDIAGHNVALGSGVTSLDSIEFEPRWARQNLTDGYFYGHVGSGALPKLAELQRRRDELMAQVTDLATRAELEGLSKGLDTAKALLAALPPPQVVYAGTVHQGSGAFRGTGADGGKPRPIFVLARGDVKKPGKEVGPGTVRFIPDAEEFSLPPGHSERERRVALARWVADTRNPLTWRSIVNRVWQYHFGRGLVDSPNDFGRMGQKPSHPELLDWLAIEFRDGGQSLKQLHRLIVTSKTYRQSSSAPGAATDENEKTRRGENGLVSSSRLPVFPSSASLPPRGEDIDADNRLVWRQNRRKLEAEAVRDSLLAIAGRLDLRMGGPSFRDFVVEKPEHSPHYEYYLHDPEDPRSHRRSVYRFLVRSQPQPFMATLDCADPSMSVDKRNETLNALQALALMNNKLTVAMARHFAVRVEGTAASPEARVAAAFRLALGREPDADELRTLASYTREHGLANACRLILNLNEFVFVD